MSAAKLYTPELLALAVELADHPLDPALPFIGEARSATCGSTLALHVAIDKQERIARLGLQVRACAVGQAAAAIFARHAVGRDAAQLEAAATRLRAWLEGSVDRPQWPDLALIEPARAYPGRHGAILLAWQAATRALSTAPAPR